MQRQPAPPNPSSRFLKPPPHERSRPPPPPRHIPVDRSRPSQSHKPAAFLNSNANVNPFAPNLPIGTNGSLKQPKILDILPFCTNRGRLSEADITNIGEVAGSLRELVLLSLYGKVARKERDVLEAALGVEVARGVRLFWVEEWVED